MEVDNNFDFALRKFRKKCQPLLAKLDRRRRWISKGERRRAKERLAENRKKKIEAKQKRLEGTG